MEFVALSLMPEVERAPLLFELALLSHLLVAILVGLWLVWTNFAFRRPT